ncbi:MAG: NAD(P)-binding protein [Deltaproteobacteria bacterium]|nr:NAD(P)-binding protein [Deltaproteobacteria bacterium]
MNSQSDKITLIVGAGVTALTAAYLLAKAGVQTIIVEKDDKVGGLCRSLKIDGIVFDIGPHVFLSTPYPECDKFILDILKQEEMISGKFQFAIHAKGRYWKFPNQLQVPFYPWRYKKQIISCLLKKNKGQGDPDSLMHWISSKSGIDFYNDLFKDLFLKKTLMPGDRVHKDWYLRADRDIFNQKEPFKPLPLLDLVKMLLSKMKSCKTYYPEEGFELFIKSLWNEYTQAQGNTILDCGPLALEKEQDRIKRVEIKGRKYDIKNIIWTGSVNELNSLLGADDCPELEYVTILSVYLTYNMTKKVERPFVYTYHPDPDLIFNRIYYPRNIFGKRSPSDREGINLECSLSKDYENFSDEEIIDRAVKDIEKLGLYKSSELREKHLIKLNKAMPVYGLDYEEKMEKTFSEIHKFSNLFSIGRQGGYYFCLSTNAVYQGIKMADYLLQNK